MLENNAMIVEWKRKPLKKYGTSRGANEWYRTVKLFLRCLFVLMLGNMKRCYGFCFSLKFWQFIAYSGLFLLGMPKLI